MAIRANAGLPPLDPDALAKRFLSHQDLYQKTRDEALAVYAAENPTNAPYNDDCRTVIRLFAYLAVWGDFYGEGLWKRGVNLANDARAHGARSMVIDSFQFCEGSRNFSADVDPEVVQVNSNANFFTVTHYPPLLKMYVLMSALDNLNGYIQHRHPDPSQQSMHSRGIMIALWGESYRALIKTGVPSDFLFEAADMLLHAIEDDEESQGLAAAEIDNDLNNSDANTVVRQELQGDAMITDAWCARGSGWANSVTSEGWKLFGERLAKADAFLEPLFEKYPKEINICHLMINVELGQGQGRTRMETWFRRGVALDPHSYLIYNDKAWYLEPRWHGSVQDLRDFGQQCAATQDWAAKIPLVYTSAIVKVGEADGDAEADESIYQDPQLWADLEKVYRGYLDRYPNAIFYRTSFAKHAFNGGHPEVAKEQFAILGDDWDRDVQTDEKHKAMLAKLSH